VANLYGVANAPGFPLAYNLIGGADIALPTGVETNIIDSGVITAPSQGYFYPIAWLALVFSLGATPPGGLQIAIRVNGGADQQAYGWNGAFLIASANLMDFHILIGTPSQIFAPGAGAHVQISAQSQTQPSTARFAGSEAVIALYRAPDQ